MTRASRWRSVHPRSGRDHRPINATTTATGAMASSISTSTHAPLLSESGRSRSGTNQALAATSAKNEINQGEGTPPTGSCRSATTKPDATTRRNMAAKARILLDILREAGFPLEVAAYGWDTIASFVTGFVLQEQSAPFGPSSVPEEPERLAEIVDPHLFPNLTEWLSRSPHDPDGYFDAKLGLIIDGLRAQLS